MSDSRQSTPALTEVMVHLHFLGHHGLALDHLLRRVALGDAVHDGVGLVHRLRPVHLARRCGQPGVQALEQLGQLRTARGRAPGCRRRAGVRARRRRGTGCGACPSAKSIAPRKLRRSCGSASASRALRLKAIGWRGGVRRACSSRTSRARRGVRRSRKLARCSPRRASPCFSKAAVDVEQAAAVGAHHLGCARVSFSAAVLSRHHRPRDVGHAHAEAAAEAAALALVVVLDALHPGQLREQRAAVQVGVHLAAGGTRRCAARP